MFNQHLLPYFQSTLAIIDEANLENPTSKQAALTLRILLENMQQNYKMTTTPDNLYRRLATLNSLIAYHLLTLPKQQALTHHTSNWLRKLAGRSKTYNYMCKLNLITTRLNTQLCAFDTQNEQLPQEVISKLQSLLEYNKMQTFLNNSRSINHNVSQLHNNELATLVNKQPYPSCHNFELLEHYAAAHAMLVDSLNRGYYLRDNNNQKKLLQWAYGGLFLSGFIGGSLTLLGSLAIGLYNCDSSSNYENSLYAIINSVAKKNAFAFADLLDAYACSEESNVYSSIEKQINPLEKKQVYP